MITPGYYSRKYGMLSQSCLHVLLLSFYTRGPPHRPPKFFKLVLYRFCCFSSKHFVFLLELGFSCYARVFHSVSKMFVKEPSVIFSNFSSNSIDVDECSVGDNVCGSPDQLCKNNYGSFVCECQPGTTRNGNECKGTHELKITNMHPSNECH